MTQRKGYYDDGQKRTATILYRGKFNKRYLELERRMFRWIHISKEESDTLQMNNTLPKNSGYHYTDESGRNMVEYHVDSCKIFQKRMNEDTEFDGRLSVRMGKDEKPLISLGHDECIFK